MRPIYFDHDFIILWFPQRENSILWTIVDGSRLAMPHNCASVIGACASPNENRLHTALRRNAEKDKRRKTHEQKNSGTYRPTVY